jgi:hypothetical protein
MQHRLRRSAALGVTRAPKNALEISKSVIPSKDQIARFKTRSVLSLIDQRSGNNATILPSVTDYRGQANTNWYPVSNGVSVMKAKLQDQPYGAVGCGMWGIDYGYYEGRHLYRFIWDYAYVTGWVEFVNDYYTFIIHKAKLWIRPITEELTEENILYIINNIAPTQNGNNTWASGHETDVWSFTGNQIYVSLFLGTITENVLAWDRKYIANNDAVFCDALNPENNCSILLTAYSFEGQQKEIPYAHGSTYFLDNGYGGVSGRSDKHNLARSFIEFTNECFDRSNTTIFNSKARSANSFYDESNPLRWHITELRRATFVEYCNDDYKDRYFVKIEEDEHGIETALLDIIVYSTNQTGVALQRLLQYVGSEYLYLNKPYAEVVKITALEDSVFKFNVNHNFVYTWQEIADIILAMEDMWPNEPVLSKTLRFFRRLFQYDNDWKQDSYSENDPLYIINATSYRSCATCFPIYYVQRILNAAAKPWGHGGHGWNNIPGVGMLDVTYGRYYAKNRTQFFDQAEFELDSVMLNEDMIRIHTYDYYPYPASQWNGTDFTIGNPGLVTEPMREMQWRLPEGAFVEFPLKPKRTYYMYQGVYVEMPVYNNILIALVTLPAGVTGVVELPTLLLYATGEGTVKLNDITYTLPTNEAALGAVIRDKLLDYRSIEVLTNTNGVQLEFLLNVKTMTLKKHNKITKGIISGNIAVSSTIPNDAFTVQRVYISPINVKSLMTQNHTTFYNPWDFDYWCLRMPTTNNLFHIERDTFGALPKPPFDYRASNGLFNFSPMTPLKQYNNLCFAPYITPRISVFEGTLEITMQEFNDGSTIYYTLDGNDPTDQSTVYSAPFTISQACTIKAFCKKTGYKDSHILSRTMVLNFEMIPNGGFDTTDNWTMFNGWGSISGGKANFANTGSWNELRMAPDQILAPLTAGIKYILEFDLETAQAHVHFGIGECYLPANWLGGCNETTEWTPGHHVVRFTAPVGVHAGILFYGMATHGVYSIDNVSLKRDFS